jgi:predicted nucleic acid-binding protein
MADNAWQDLLDLQALALVTFSTADLLQPALKLALAYDITVYDINYAALAQGLNLPFVTADTTLARKIAGSGITIPSLADYE